MRGGQGMTGRVAFDSGLLEVIAAAVVVTDLDGMIVAANRRAEDLYGRSREELVGHDSTHLRAGPLPDDLQAEIGAAILAGRTWEGEFTIRRADGTPLGIPLLDSPAFDEAGRLVGVVAIALDVTENRHEWDDPEPALAGSRVLRGRPVLFAGETVVISLLGLFVIGLSFFRGLAVGASLAVALVMAAAVTLLPAVLGFVGRTIDRLSLPGARERREKPADRTVWARWSRTLQARPWPAAIAGLLVLLVLTAPAATD